MVVSTVWSLCTVAMERRGGGEIRVSIWMVWYFGFLHVRESLAVVVFIPLFRLLFSSLSSSGHGLENTDIMKIAALQRCDLCRLMWEGDRYFIPKYLILTLI